MQHFDQDERKHAKPTAERSNQKRGLREKLASRTARGKKNREKAIGPQRGKKKV